MIYKKISLKDFYPHLKSEATLEIVTPILLDDVPNAHACIIVVPGGGYAFCSNREGDPIASRFLSLGYATATLIYTVRNQQDKEMIYPKPQLELLASIDYLKKHAQEFLLDKDKISVVGFSAGGHLAATSGYMYKNKEFLKLLNAEQDLKPYSICLCYPVISSKKEITHPFTIMNLCNFQEDIVKYVDVNTQVTSDYPPTYIWTTDDDPVVPAVNTKLMIEALKRHQVKFESVIYPHGIHGLATADIITNPEKDCHQDIAKWPFHFDAFIKSL